MDINVLLTLSDPFSFQFFVRFSRPVAMRRSLGQSGVGAKCQGGAGE